MGVVGPMTTERDDFSITIDSRLFIFFAVMPQMSLHQPCLGVVWIYAQDSIEKNLRNVPSFLSYCTCSVRSINQNL